MCSIISNPDLFQEARTQIHICMCVLVSMYILLITHTHTHSLPIADPIDETFGPTATALGLANNYTYVFSAAILV